jgi:uncharacterized RDD family membrane protein YckC
MALSYDVLRIETPENVTFGYRIAGIGSRFLAGLVDTFLIMMLLFSEYYLSYLVLRNASISSSTYWLVAIYGIVSFVSLWGFYILFEMAWNGQTPGKRWLGIRVIRLDGSPISLSESIIRNLVRLFDFLPAYYGVGITVMFFNHQSRRLGDLAAGTVVIHDRSSLKLETLLSSKNQATPLQDLRPVSASANGLPIEHLTRQDVLLGEEYLNRREQLLNRNALAEHILRTIYNRMDVPYTPMSPTQTEDMLVAIIKAGRERLTG